MLALIVGATRLAMGLIGVGNFTKYLIRPVILGFTTAAAVLIICSQVSKILGANPDASRVIVRAFKSLTESNWSLEAILVAAGAFAIAHFSKRIHRLFPSILLAIVVSVLYSWLRGYPGETVGALSGKFVSLQTNIPWHLFDDLIRPGLVIAIVGFAEPTSISMTLMEEENLEWNPNRELCGGGFANLFSGLFGGYPIGGSFSRTSVNKFAGATSAWSGLITGSVVLCMLGLTPLLSPLPVAALGGIIVLAVLRLIKFNEMLEVWSANKIHGAVSFITLVSTLVFAPRVHVGILIGASLGICVTLLERRFQAES